MQWMTQTASPRLWGVVLVTIEVAVVPQEVAVEMCAQCMFNTT